MGGGRRGGEVVVFFFQAEDGIRDFCLSRGLGDVYKRQLGCGSSVRHRATEFSWNTGRTEADSWHRSTTTTRREKPCLLYTSDAADEEDSVDLGGRRVI
ncbi:hypothetical protein CDFC105_93952 [Clostridioides difficile]|nr:hypothetical protein CDFC105_93952 [Clostridioides difficile]